MSTVTDVLSYHLDVTHKSHKEIADEVGFPRANIISMLRNGSTKVPLARAVALAKSLDIDPTMFFRACMNEYAPDLLAVCDEVYGHEKLSPQEREVIARIRLVSKGSAPALTPQNSPLLDDWIKSAAGK
jgi:plasmid maintenance system antidote protein VapI